MKTKKKVTRTEEFVRASRELRSRVEILLKTVAELASESAEILSASLAIGVETLAWKALSDRVNGGLEQATLLTKSRRDQVAEEYVDQFRRQLTSAGHVVHGEGSLLIVNGIIYIELDLINAKAKVNGKAQNDLSPDTLRGEIEAEGAALANAITEPTSFVGQLRRSYDQVIAGGKLSAGSQVMTTDLLPPLVLHRQTARFLADPTAGSFTEYPMNQFRADLFNLLKSDVPASSGFHWAPGSNTRGAVFMFVPALGRATHVGRIWFEQTNVEV